MTDADIGLVQEYSRHTKLLKKTQASKAQKFLEFDCIKYVGFDSEFGVKNSFLCLPLNRDAEVLVDGKSYSKKPYLKNYNCSEYKIARNVEGLWECNCQGWQTKAKRGEWFLDGCMCSHVLALMYAFKMRRFGVGKS